MKKIWKKPGTTTWKKAMKKSAGRMAKDLLRIPDYRLGKIAEENYFKNKSGKETRFLRKLIAQNKEKRALLAKELPKTIVELSKKESKMVEGINNLVERYNQDNTIQNAAILVNSTKAIIVLNLDLLKTFEQLKKNTPKSGHEKINKKTTLIKNNITYYVKRYFEFQDNVKEKESEL